MNSVYVSIGSNIESKKNIQQAIDLLKEFFGEIVLSPIYESEAVGFEGDNFLNLVVKVETDLSVGDISRLFKSIEDKNGRDRTAEKFSARTIDLDILTYGNNVGRIDTVDLPRDEITKNAFVLLPLSDIAPDEKHPVLQQSYASLWDNYDKSKQQLWRVEL